MNTQRKNRVLFVVTNHEDLGDTGKKTGYFLREVSYPYKAVTEAGYSVDFVSPNGGPAPMDPNSNDMDDEVNKAFTDDSSIMDQLQNTMSPDQINPNDYDGIMYAEVRFAPELFGEKGLTLDEIITAVHLEKKHIRFWATPDNKNAWTVLEHAGVDLINTDKISEYSNYKLSN